MKNWWNARAPRERVILGLAGIVLVIMLYFLMVWEPLVKGIDSLNTNRKDAAELNAWLQSIEPELTTLRRGSNANRPTGQGSVLSLANASAKAVGLGAAVKRMQPDGDNTVRVWLEAAPFNTMLAWLQKLDKQYAIKVADLNISRDTKAGQVKARLTLKR